MFDWGQIIGPIIGTGMGLALEDHNDKRQIRQQQALTNQQKVANMDLMDYQAQKQMDIWNKTNYDAQVGKMKEAGLNPALMYKGAGGGGQTMSIGAGGVTGGQAPQGGGEVQHGMGMGMQMAMQAALLKAQIENINADTKNKLASNPNIGKEGVAIDTNVENTKVDTELKNKQIENLTAGIKNTEAETKLKEVAINIAKWDLNFKDQTLDAQIKMATANSSKAIDEAQIALNEAKVATATSDAKIVELKAMAVGQLLKNALTSADIKNRNQNTELQKAQTAVTNQAFNQNIQRLMMDWDKYGQDSKRTNLQQALNGAQIDKMSMDMITSGINSIMGMTRGAEFNEYRYYPNQN